MQEEKTIVIDIKLTKRLVLLLSCGLTIAALLAYLALTGESAAAVGKDTSGETSLAQSIEMRRFYLSWGWYSAIDAPNSCAAGYHFASLWEIADPSNLKYNTSLGRDKDDSGEGPPSGYYARLRTGYASDNSATPGNANCDGWTSTTGQGTKAALLPNWSSSPDIGVWDVMASDCSATSTIWCVED
jgi:hypothetical protein